MVHTNNGLVPIETIVAGSVVWTMNELTGQRELKTVTETYRRTTLSMIVLELQNGNIFEVTPEHRFFVNSNWREIEHIAVGEEFELVDGGKNQSKKQRVSE